jgi:hypothetical protein
MIPAVWNLHFDAAKRTAKRTAWRHHGSGIDWILTMPGQHGTTSIVSERVPDMAYLLPRAILIVLAWGMTCALIRKLWPEADPTIFGVAGASWLVGGFAYFGYLRKLRRDIEALERGLRR